MNEHCDRCGAAAKARIVLPSGNDLFFCGHHTREYHNVISDVATDVILDDELAALA